VPYKHNRNIIYKFVKRHFFTYLHHQVLSSEQRDITLDTLLAMELNLYFQEVLELFWKYDCSRTAANGIDIGDNTKQ
jgi:hypothetical protein